VHWIDAEFSASLNRRTVLGLYEDSGYKSESKKVHLKQADIIVLGSDTEVDQKLKYANDLPLGVKFGRELVNSPANVLTPAQQIFHQTLIVLHRFIVSILIAVILLSLSVVLAEVSKVASTYSDDLELQWIGYALFDLDLLY
jgi:leucyl aminopeptidase